MARDWAGTGTFSGRPNHDLYLYSVRNATDVPGNRSNYLWELRARRNSGAVSFDLGSYPWSITFGGQPFSGNGVLDFRSTAQIVLGSGTSQWFTHDAAGNLNISIGASMTNAGLFGSAALSGIFSVDRIVQPGVPVTSPGIPGAPWLSDNTITNIRVASDIPPNNGAAITRYGFQWGRSADLTVGLITAENGGYLFDIGKPPNAPLVPGTDYWVRTRAYNSAGWSAYGPTSKGTTLPSVFVSDGTTWKPAQVLVDSGSTWNAATLQLSDGTAWTVAG